MTNVMIPTIAAAVLATTGAMAAPCAGQPDISLEVKVQEAPIKVVQDITLEELRAAADRLRLAPIHPVFGFYAGTVGYVLRDLEVSDAPPTSDTACRGFRIKAELVVVDRRIAVAREFAAPSCRYKAALDHYRRHAAAASVALHRFAAGLQDKIAPEIRQRALSRPQTSDDMQRYVDTLLDAALGDFNASLPQLQREVDSTEEIQRVSTPCDET